MCVCVPHHQSLLESSNCTIHDLTITSLIFNHIILLTEVLTHTATHNVTCGEGISIVSRSVRTKFERLKSSLVGSSHRHIKHLMRSYDIT